MLTGESLPVEKGPGDTVIGATLNKTGSFVFRATKVGRDTTLAQIVRLVEEAQGSKAPMQRLADTISGYFVPAVLVLAALTFVGWLICGPSRRVSCAIQAAIAVLIIACPCALGSGHADRDHGRHRARRPSTASWSGAARRWRWRAGSTRSCSTRPAP